MVMAPPLVNMPEVATPPTVRRKLLLADAPLASVTMTVIVALPLTPVTGVMVRLRLVPKPPNTILVAGARAGLEDVALTTRLLAGVSASPTVKGMGGVVVLTGVVWSSRAVRTGAELGGGALVRVRASVQPPARAPESFVESSTMYSDHTPFGSVPLKTERVAP